MAGEARGRWGLGHSGQGGQLVGGQPLAPGVLAELQEPPDTFLSDSPNFYPRLGREGQGRPERKVEDQGLVSRVELLPRGGRASSSHSLSLSRVPGQSHPTAAVC